MGSVDVTVTSGAGTSSASAADLYTYGSPTVTSVSTDVGPTAGGTSVTIAGTGFAPDSKVTFGSQAATAVTVTSSTSITATAPAGTAGSVDVTVTTPAGTSPTSIYDLFAYGAPVIASVAPDAGPLAGGNDVIVAGAGFVPGLTVYFGNVESPSATVLAGGTGFTAVVPAGTAGPVDITVSTPMGTSTTSTADLYFYGAPTVTKISPASGTTTGGTAVTISGTGFAPDATVAFGLQAATSVAVDSPSSITAIAPAANPGVIDVRVGIPAGLSAMSAADLFEYDDQLQISCGPPPAASTSCNSIDLPSVSLRGQWQRTSAPANTLFVTDDRGDSAVGWSLSAYVVPTTDNPNSACDDWSGFCDTTAASIGNTTDFELPANYLSINDLSCAPRPGTEVPFHRRGPVERFLMGLGRFHFARPKPDRALARSR